MALKWPAIALGSLLALAVAFGAGRYSAPPHEITHTEWLTTTREIRTVVVQRVTDTKIKRVVVVDTKPDGSSHSVETEDSSSHEETRSAENTETSKTDKGATKVESYPSDKNWLLYGSVGVVGLTLQNPSARPTVVWGIGAHRRVLWNIWLGASYQSNGSVSGTLGLGF